MVTQRVIKIFAGDPGLQRDSFAGVYIETRENSIIIKGAKRWLGIEYPDVEKEIASLYESIKFDYVVIETNNTGFHVIQDLRRYFKVPITAVNTSTNIKDPKKIIAGKTMDKVAMSDYMLKLKQEKRIKFAKPTPEIAELIRQLETWQEKKTSTGKRSFGGVDQDHDDAVMALMLACFIAQKHIETQQGVAVGHRNYRDENLEGDGYSPGPNWVKLADYRGVSATFIPK